MASIRVEAIKKGYHGLQLREVGDQFDLRTIDTTTKNTEGDIVPITITPEEQFSKKWMVKVGAKPVREAEPPKAEKATGRASDQSKI